ncbi:MAG: TonB-dependent receptor [Acidobacteria bacterium]|nr:TonB-dependent receptor [Acidobacteriota bacterium]
MKLKHLLALLLCLSFINLSAQAQSEKASIRGIITDATGARIAKVAIKVTNKNTNEIRTVSSDDEGAFAISLLPPGSYRFEAEAAGFRKYKSETELQVNQILRLDFSLEAGLQGDLDITPPLSQLKKDSPSLGAVIENRQVTGLPLDGRNFLELALLTPGAVNAAPGSAGSVRGDFAFSINGGREDSNNFLLDGAYNVDPKLNTFAIKPPVDAVSEFEVLSSSYDASFGRNAGAQINIVVKTGSNNFHGSAYEFFRNGALDARNFFAPKNEAAPEYNRHQFGASLGGAIIKNKTFFFADYEGTRIREGLTRVTNVPTLAERNGDFSQSVLAKPINPFTQQRFPGDQIPSFFLNPIGKAIANLYPLPNRNVPLQNFVSSPLQRDRNHQFDVRFDHQLNDASHLAARYSFADRNLFEPFGGPSFAAIPGFGNNVPRRAQNAMIGETHLFNPRVINEARFAFNRVAANVTQEGAGISLNRQVGLPEVSTRERDFGLSFITLTGFSAIGHEYNNPQQSVTNTYQFSDTVGSVIGQHYAKFGFDFRATQQNAFRDVQARGLISFIAQAQITGNALADMLLGAPVVTGVARLDNPQHLRTRSYNFFINDSYRLTPKVTLTAGLRYEYNTPAVDTNDRARIYDLASHSLLPVGVNGIPRAGYRADKNNFAPRLGLAWTLRDTTVLRAGYGIYYDQSSLAPGEGLYFNKPYFDFNLYVTSRQFPLSLANPFPTNLPFTLPSSAFTFQRDLRTPYTQQYNVNLQQQLGASRIFEIAYVGAKGTKLFSARDINQPFPRTAFPNLRPDPRFDDINILESRSNSNYNALQIRLQQHTHFGLSFLSSYTWSKSIDDASGFFTSAGDANFPQDSHNVRAERGRSNFDVRQRFSMSYGYDLPIGKGHKLLGDQGWLTPLFTGWQTFGIITLQSGRPFTVALLPDIDNSNTGRSNLGFGANDRPNIVSNAEVSNPSPDRWFNTSAFAFPPFGSFGNAGRNILTGPDYQNVNASLVKDTKIKESVNLQFRAEFFNLFNHPNFDLPDNFLGSPTFGQIRSAQSPRHLQFGLKLLF